MGKFRKGLIIFELRVGDRLCTGVRYRRLLALTVVRKLEGCMCTNGCVAIASIPFYRELHGSLCFVGVNEKERSMIMIIVLVLLLV